MPLTMRPTGLGSGIDKDRPDYAVYCGGLVPEPINVVSPELRLDAGIRATFSASCSTT
jgi:hypothetical protein